MSCCTIKRNWPRSPSTPTRRRRRNISCALSCFCEAGRRAHHGAAMQVISPLETRRSDVHLLYAARCLRGFGDGFAVVILPAYLSAIGFGPVQIGFIATVSLFG